MRRASVRGWRLKLRQERKSGARFRISLGSSLSSGWSALRSDKADGVGKTRFRYSGYRASVVVATAWALAAQASVAGAQQSAESYTYDALGRLIKVEVSGGQNDAEVHSLCYDAAGNRVEYKATSDGSQSSCVTDGISAPPTTPTQGSIVIPASCRASSNYNNYTGLSGSCGGMRDSVFNIASSIHGTNSDTNGSWVEMDLGSQQSIGTVHAAPIDTSLTWGPAYLNNAQVQISSDQTNWSAVGTIAATQDGVASSATMPNGTSARYVRLHKAGFLGLGDFFARAPASYTPPPAPPSGSVILPSGCSASSNYNNYTGLTGNCSGIQDGVYNLSSSIHGTFSDVSGSWVLMDLGVSRAISTAFVVPIDSSLTWGPTYLTGAQVQISSNGLNWTTVGSIAAAQDGSPSTVPIGATARYIRLFKSGWLGVGDFFVTAQ